jgi:hypothetical protein
LYRTHVLQARHEALRLLMAYQLPPSCHGSMWSTTSPVPRHTGLRTLHTPPSLANTSRRTRRHVADPYTRLFIDRGPLRLATISSFQSKIRPGGGS